MLKLSVNRTHSRLRNPTWNRLPGFLTRAAGVLHVYTAVLMFLYAPSQGKKQNRKGGWALWTKMCTERKTCFPPTEVWPSCFSSYCSVCPCLGLANGFWGVGKGILSVYPCTRGPVGLLVDTGGLSKHSMHGEQQIKLLVYSVLVYVK